MHLPRPSCPRPGILLRAQGTVVHRSEARLQARQLSTAPHVSFIVRVLLLRRQPWKPPQPWRRLIGTYQETPAQARTPCFQLLDEKPPCHPRWLLCPEQQDEQQTMWRGFEPRVGGLLRRGQHRSRRLVLLRRRKDRLWNRQHTAICRFQLRPGPRKGKCGI